jgi:hypothetical protein
VAGRVGEAVEAVIVRATPDGGARVARVTKSLPTVASKWSPMLIPVG